MNISKYKPGDLLLFDDKYFRYVKKLYPEPSASDGPNRLTYVTDPTANFYKLLKTMEEQSAILIYQENRKIKDFSAGNVEPTQVKFDDFTIFCFLINNQTQFHAYYADKFSTSNFSPYLFLGKN